MDTLQILCVMQGVKSFVGVFASDLIPHSVTRSGSLIINTDPHTEKGTHWLAIHIQPKSSCSFYFDSYGFEPIIPTIQTFLRRNSVVCEYNKVTLQGLMSDVCGQYCCLFALYMDRGYTPKQFVGLFDTHGLADSQVSTMFTSEFGSVGTNVCGGQCCTALYKRLVYSKYSHYTSIPAPGWMWLSITRSL
jgi:hypothetical protein